MYHLKSLTLRFFPIFSVNKLILLFIPFTLLFSTLINAETNPYTAQYYLNLASTHHGNIAVYYTILSAKNLLANHEPDAALKIFKTIDGKQITSKTKPYYDALNLRLSFVAGNYKQTIAKALSKENIILLPALWQQEIYEALAISYYNLHSNLNAAKNLIQYHNYLQDNAQIAKNNTKIWFSLNKLSISDLQNHLQSENTLLRGWFSLAYLNKQYKLQHHKLFSNFNTWLINYPHHPAASTLNLPLLKQQLTAHHTNLSTNNSLHTIALILPTEGEFAKAAKTIREGFLAAFYQESGSIGSNLSNSSGFTHRPRKINLYDCTTNNIASLYNKAINDGADLIVGPLTKDTVDLMVKSNNWYKKVPVVTLNLSKVEVALDSNLVQFALNLENEIDLIAQRGLENGFTHPALIVTNNNLHERIVRKFKEVWPYKQITNLIFTSDPTNFVKSALHIDTSEQRAQHLRETLKTKLNFKVRRRQDIDFIVFSGSQEQAQSLKPMLNFYYADNIPLYATSTVYSGESNAKLDKDLDNIIFCDLPELLTGNITFSNYQHILHKKLPYIDDPRLFLMGMDAYLIANNIHALLVNPYLALEGKTGNLYLNQEHKIIRQLPFAKFKQGVPTLNY